MPWRKTFSMKLWNWFDCGTSRKSARKPPTSFPLWPPGSVTTTSFRLPGVSAGVFAVNCVELTKVTPVAGLAPIETVGVGWKFAPRIVTKVPAADGPDEGLMLETVGPDPGVGLGVGVGVGVAVAVGVGVGVSVAVAVGVVVTVGV